MNLKYYFYELWSIFVDHGLPLIALLLIGILIPRIGRLAIRIMERRLDEDEEATKARLALTGALVYIVQAAAYFLIIWAALTNIGVPAVGAAVPATNGAAKLVPLIGVREPSPATTKSDTPAPSATRSRIWGGTSRPTTPGWRCARRRPAPAGAPPRAARALPSQGRLDGL